MSDSPNFLTYAQTAFDSFDERPFCAVDSLVFAWLSYLRLPQDMSELEGWQGLDVRELLRAECYRDMVAICGIQREAVPCWRPWQQALATVACTFAAIVP